MEDGLKVVFFGNSDFSVKPFEKIIENFDVVALVTAPDTVIGRGQKKARINPVKEIAIKNNIPIVQPAKLKNNQEFHQQLVNLNADIHVVVSYGKIIPHDLIFIPKYNTINLHASLLPKFRGAAPIQYSLWQGLSCTGNTVQFINEKMDEGDIIGQSIVPISPEDDYVSLEKKLSENGAQLVIECLQKIKINIALPIKQNHDEATYTKLIAKEDGAVYFSMSAQEIFDAYRAFIIWPGIYAPLDLGHLKILECSIWDRESKNEPGTILDINDQGIVIACDEGSILLKTVQLPTKKPLHGRDFCNGIRLKKGSILSHNIINI